MYVREKKIRRGEKTYTYWQVVQGTRVDGKVRQTVIAHLGGEPKDRKQADILARMKGVLCGVLRCGEAASVELEHWGFRPTHTLKLRDGRELEGPYLVCPAHLEDYRRGQTYYTVPLLFKDP
jgi:hypothetical protein